MNTDWKRMNTDGRSSHREASSLIRVIRCYPVFITFKLAMLKLTQYVLETRTETAKFD